MREDANRQFLALNPAFATLPPAEIKRWLEGHPAAQQRFEAQQQEAHARREAIYDRFTAERARLQQVNAEGGAGKVGYVFVGDLEYNPSKKLDVFNATLRNIITLGFLTGKEPSRLEDHEALIRQREEMLRRKFEKVEVVYLAHENHPRRGEEHDAVGARPLHHEGAAPGDRQALRRHTLGRSGRGLAGRTRARRHERRGQGALQVRRLGIDVPLQEEKYGYFTFVAEKDAFRGKLAGYLRLYKRKGEDPALGPREAKERGVEPGVKYPSMRQEETGLGDFVMEAPGSAIRLSLTPTDLQGNRTSK